MKCSRCGNQEIALFFKDEKGWYCRNCIAFGKIYVGEEVVKRELSTCRKNVCLQLPYALTKKQKVLSDQLCNAVKFGQDVLVYAACGAGKTEIVMPLIEQMLQKQKNVGFAISRREVVLELKERFQTVFPNIQVIAVCAGYTAVDEGDLIICTTHQLYRYPKSFDVLILDEIDAFPYAGNELLKALAKNACVGETIYLTATPDHELKKSVEKGELLQLKLFERPHGYPLVEPKLFRMPVIFQYIHAYYWMKKNKKTGPILLFVPTIQRANEVQRWMNPWIRVGVLTSKSKEKEETIYRFKNKEISVLIATTILERGITIDGVQVLILEGDHAVFQEASLVQMVGRVGRKKECPTGYAAIYGKKRSASMLACVASIRKMNVDA